MLSGFKSLGGHIELSSEDIQLIDSIILNALENQKPSENLVINILTNAEIKKFHELGLEEFNKFGLERVKKFNARLRQLLVAEIHFKETVNQVELRFRPKDEQKLRAHFLPYHDLTIPVANDVIPLESDIEIQSHIKKALETHQQGDLYIDGISDEQARAYNQRLLQMPLKKRRDLVMTINSLIETNSERIDEWMTTHEIDASYDGNVDINPHFTAPPYPSPRRIICPEKDLPRLFAALGLQRSTVNPQPASPDQNNIDIPSKKNKAPTKIMVFHNSGFNDNWSYDREIGKYKGLLQKVGLQVSPVQQKERDYFAYLELPDTMQCKIEYLGFYRRAFTIYLADVPIISINQSMSNVSFYIDAENIEHALKKDTESSPTFLLTPFQKAIETNFKKLKTTSVDNHEKSTLEKKSDDVIALERYRRENPYEVKLIASRLLASDETYNQLFEQFPQLITELPHKIENNDPGIIELKGLCFEYAADLYKSVGYADEETSKSLLNNKINNYHYDRNKLTYTKLRALKELRQTLDSATSLDKDQTTIETLFNKIKTTFKEDKDPKMIRFLKQFGRILKALFTATYSLRKKEALQTFNTPKFWKSAQELRGKAFIKDIKEHANIKKKMSGKK